MATVNQALADETVAHGEALHRYANNVVRRIIALLNRTDADLVARLNDALDRLPLSRFSVDALDALLTSVRDLNAQAYRAIGIELAEEMRRLVEYEAGFQLELFRSTLPAQAQASVGVASVQADQVYTAALARPFQGRLLREWTAGLDTARAARIRDQVRIGYVEQQTVAQIVQRVRGTRAKAYRDGALEIDRRGAEAVVRTAVSHFAGVTRDAFFAANADLIESEAWTSTLDSRTSETCRVRDGKQYTVETHKPIGHSLPWLGGPGRAHWCCRSTAAPVVKSWQALGIDAADLSPSTRASMDGQVPADLTFAQWLKRQSAERQDDVLGETRAKLFRDGMALDRFYTDKGRYLTLDELRARDSAAFKRAGV